jgi:energy-coupling factor transporter ATP-binding protein EcfA2
MPAAIHCPPVIILRDISLRRAEKLLLEGASATLLPGQRLALTGPNGCGKSSLFALLRGDLAPDGGNIEGLGQLPSRTWTRMSGAGGHAGDRLSCSPAMRRWRGFSTPGSAGERRGFRRRGGKPRRPSPPATATARRAGPRD